MRLNIEIDTNCVGCMARYMDSIKEQLVERITGSYDPADRPVDSETVELEYECDIACDGYQVTARLFTKEESGEVEA